MKSSKPAPAKSRAGLDKSHNPANQLSAMPGYSNGGLVRDMGMTGSSSLLKDKDMGTGTGTGMPGYSNGGMVKSKNKKATMGMPMPMPGYANGGLVKGKKGGC